MKLFIWEGKGISTDYYYDGTLVVLANTAEEARAIVRQTVRDRQIMEDNWMKERDDLAKKLGLSVADFEETSEGKALDERYYQSQSEIFVFAGEDSALDRDPDKVLDVDTPKVVAFRGDD